jgi:hypothetical protein
MGSNGFGNPLAEVLEMPTPGHVEEKSVDTLSGSPAAARTQGSSAGNGGISHWFKNLSVTAAVIVAFIAVAEPLFHKVRILRPLPRTYVGQFENVPSSPFLAADPVLGWKMHPNRVVGAEGWYRANARGFRSEREFDPSPAARKVVLVGDSFAFGLGVPYEKTFGAMVESRLHGTPVYNFGIPGYAMDQMWLALEHEALPLYPKLAIAAFISGDFTRSEEAYRPWEGFNKPVFKLVNGRLEPKTAQDRPGALWQFLDRRSSLFRIGRLAWRTVSTHIPVGGWWHLNEAILDRMRLACEKEGVELLFVYIPTDEWREFPSLNRYMERVRANYIDMSKDGRLPKKGTTLPDGHLNEAGNRYVADAISKWIAQNMQGL